MTPEAAMRLALTVARRVSGRTFPNPAVGAIVFRGDRVLGRGATRPPGGPHAEVVALHAALRRAGARSVRGASMAVTLEPCCHAGRTGPCTDAIVRAGIRRVYVGHVDPHPDVAGRGVRRLRRAGVLVEVGVLADGCREQNRGFVSLCERGRPWVTLKLGTSLDGRIAIASGESRWITGPAARARVHALRAHVDAVAVGSGTALADDPSLTARRGRRVVHRPMRVVFDSRLRVPASSRIFAAEGASAVVCGARAPRVRRARLERAGVRVLPVRLADGHVDLRRGLAALGGIGLTHLMIEGGGTLAAALLRRGLVDDVEWFIAPKFLGSDGRAAVGALSLRDLPGAPALDDVRVRRLAQDLWIRGTVRANQPAARGDRRTGDRR